MKKCLFIGLLLIELLFPANSWSKPLFYIHVEEFTCEGKYYNILFSVINGYTYDQDITVAFKIIQGGKVVGCKRINMLVPRNSDGSELRQVIINTPCQENQGETILKSMLFPKDRKNRVGFWLSDCP